MYVNADPFVFFALSLSQDRSLHGLAQKFENQIFTAAMNVEDYNSRINKKLSKVQKVGRVIFFFLWEGRDAPHVIHDTYYANESFHVKLGSREQLSWDFSSASGEFYGFVFWVSFCPCALGRLVFFVSFVAMSVSW